MADKRTFSKLVVENQQILHKITMIYANNAEDREDLFQEICLQLWKSHDRFEKRSKFSTWAFRIALNTAINYIRSRKREIHPQPLIMDFPDTEIQNTNEENARKLFEAISKLNRINKAVILLWLEDKNYGEISEILGISKSNVSVKLVRIKKKLNEMINKN